MESNKTYMDIVSEYGACRSITKIAKKLGVSEERVRRTLITEGLWTSRAARPIVELYQEGKTVQEIAGILMLSEKTVQSYVPYSRGMYGGERSDTAQRSGEYRKRMRKAVKGMAGNNMAQIPEGGFPETITERKTYYDGQGIKDSQTLKGTGTKSSDDTGREPGFIYRLRFDLTSRLLDGADDRYGMADDEYSEFLRLAKAKKGISRTVLVPGEMSLHAMHYMVLRLFGWQNEHLHRFALPEGTFRQLTDGEIGKWLELCGVLLRFPTGDNADLYWDDDYEPKQSVKTWLRSKYRKSFEQKSVSESLIASLDKIEDFNNRFMAPDGDMARLTKGSTLYELLHTINFEEDFNTVLERLRVCDLFLGPQEADGMSIGRWKEDALRSRDENIGDILELMEDGDLKEELDEAIDELRSWRNYRSDIASAIFYGRRAEVEEQLGRKAEEAIREAARAIPAWEDAAFEMLDPYNPEISPFLNQLYYLYDFGDDWCIRITCEKRFRRMHGRDFPDKDGDAAHGREDGPDACRYLDENGNEAALEERDSLGEVDAKGFPVCIESDGVSLVEDAGGIFGFYDMLKTLAGSDREEKKQMKEWARSLGWTGRISTPGNML